MLIERIYQKKCVFFSIIKRKTMKSESERFLMIDICLLIKEYAYQFKKSSLKKIDN